MRVPNPDNEEMQCFLDHAVHDLRASLRKIGTLVELLQEDHPGDAVFPEIMGGVARTGAILEGMTQYSTALGVISRSFTSVKLDGALTAAIRGLDSKIRETGAQITHGSLPEVVGDKERLTELFRILILNALTYRSSLTPTVEINGRAEADEWVVCVRDNGMGVAPAYQARLFEPFYRLHGSEIPGVGLGLAIGRKLVEAHRGHIWIEPEAGAGATFCFALPREHA